MYIYIYIATWFADLSRCLSRICQYTSTYLIFKMASMFHPEMGTSRDPTGWPTGGH